jgi:excisionase family DNA binding protein
MDGADVKHGNNMPTSEVGRLLTVGEVADLLRVTKTWVYQRTRRRGADRLPHIKLGKYLRFEEDAIRAFLERQRAGT